MRNIIEEQFAKWKENGTIDSKQIVFTYYAITSYVKKIIIQKSWEIISSSRMKKKLKESGLENPNRLLRKGWNGHS